MSQVTLPPTMSTTPTTPIESEASTPFKFEGTHVFAADGAELPTRCAVCGDSFELSAFRTFPGRVRYHVCREHVIAAASKLLVGGAMMLVSAYQLVDPVLDGHLPGRSTLVTFGTILVAGMALVALAIPVHAGRSRGGWRRLWGGGKALRAHGLK